MKKPPHKRILVTGGCGFIGSHLCRAAIDAGHTVRVLDLRPPREPVAEVEYRLGDINDDTAVEAALDDIDAVFHLAAVASVPACENAPVRSYETNVVGSARLLHCLARRAPERRARLTFASSSAVYGDVGKKRKPIAEKVPAVGPSSLYASQKLAMEQAIRVYHRLHGIEAFSLRLFNVFGPGLPPTSSYSAVISIFRSCLAHGEPLVLHGGGVQTRDFVFVDDVATAFLATLGASIATADGRAINIGAGKAVSIRELALTMQQVAGKKTLLTRAPSRAGDVLHSMASIQLAKKQLGWKPTTSLREGLERLYSEATEKKAAFQKAS